MRALPRTSPGREASMRDRDAATDPVMARSAWTPVRARTLVWTLFVGAVVGSCCGIALAPPPGARFEARLPWSGDAPALADWARTLRPEESARLGTGPHAAELVVSAGSAQQARALAREFAGTRAPGPRELSASLERVRAGWRGSLGPLGP